MFPALIALLAQAPSPHLREQAIELQPCRIAGVPVAIRCGTFMVYEDRAHKRGRRIPLFVRVIPSSSASPAADPFVLVSTGGPGTTNSDVVPFAYARGWARDRDVVLVDLRGTSGPAADRLDCDLPGTPESPIGYLKNVFDTVTVARCRAALEKHADLTQYTTANAMDDLYDALVALGYRRANLYGISGGTREVLEFMRRHPAMVRSAILAGVAPVSFKNPLEHARAAQEALDSLFAQCERESSCGAAFPKLRAEFARLRETASSHPITTRVPPALGGREATAQLTWAMIAETIRTMSYGGGRSIPFVIHQAALGDYGPLIEAGVESNQRTKGAIRFGFLLSQTCLEDVPRISDAEVLRETANTYLGDTRVRQQQAACRQWVHGTAPLGVGDSSPVRSDIPVFMLSGTIDPVTRPRFAADAARYLSHSIHVIAPGGHVPFGPCVDAMERQFLEAPSRPVDTSCVKSMSLLGFRVR
ncbi:MAG TPA: alpha/beta hydrolase [Gemmatimonadaceae bacterium]|nr:alpha/beta hydrolase [Gemmatimonadaceae bacterium]